MHGSDPKAAPQAPQRDGLERVAADLRPAISLLPDLGDLSETTLEAVRASLSPPPLPGAMPGVTVEQVNISSRDGGSLGALLYRPENPCGAALLYLHGGGFVSGSAQRDDAITRNIALQGGVTVLALDYRLAPEHPYPAALHDALDAYLWLHGHAGDLSIDPARVGVRGNSAGGGLAASLAIAVRDIGAPPIAWLALVYPMLDHRTSGHPYAGRFVWTGQANAWAWRAYLGVAYDDPPGTASPAIAGDLSGLPPTWIGVGDIDLFSEECLTFAARLVRAGVATELNLYSGAFHGFFLIRAAEVAMRFERDLSQAMARALASTVESVR